MKGGSPAVFAIPPDAVKIATPSVNAANIQYIQIAQGIAQVSWTRGNGSSCVVFAIQSNSGYALPADNQTYNPDTVFGNGTQIGVSGWFCIYRGTGTQTKIYGLNPRLPCRVMVCEYDGNVGSESYNSIPAAGNPFTTPFTSVCLLPLTGSGNASAAWFDLENDGDPDIITCFQASTGQQLHLLINNGSIVFKDSIPASMLQVSHGTVRVADFNNDGLTDVFVSGYNSGSGYQSKLYRNTNGVLTELAGFQPPGMAESDALWFDYNRDGYMDLLLTGFASGYYTQLFKNNGDETFSIVPGHGISGYYMVKIREIDFNRDGYPDVAARGTSANGNETVIFKNNRNGTFSKNTAATFPAMDYGSSISCADANNDGFSDLFITGSPGISRLYLNSQNGSFALFPFACTQMSNSCSDWADVNNDGNDDLFHSGYSNEIFTGTGSSFLLLPGLPSAQSYMSCATFTDADLDGDADLFYMTTQGPVLLVNHTSVINSPPSAPTGLTATNTGDSVRLSWTIPSDDHSPGQTLCYNLCLGTGTNPRQMVSPMSDLVSGRLRAAVKGNCGNLNQCVIRELPEGTYFFSVQATDQALSGGPFAVPDTFEVVKKPLVQAHHILQTASGKDFATLGWKCGNGTRRLAMMCVGNLPDIIPAENNTYVPDSVFGNGTQHGTSGWFAVYNGTDSAVTVRGLLPNTFYRIAIFEFKGVPGNEKYCTLTALQNPSDATTLPHGTLTAPGSVCTGDSVIITMSAGGNLPLRYRWFGPAADIADTLSQMRFLCSGTQDSGQYWCRLSNPGFSVNSDTTLIDADAPATISYQTPDTMVCIFSNANLRVDISGNSSFEWMFNGIPIAGETENRLHLWDIGPSDTGTYQCRVYSACDTLLSSPIRLMLVNSPVPEIGNDTTICTSAGISLSAGQIFDTYLWTGGSTSDHLWVDSSGWGGLPKNITLNVTWQGCSLSDSILIDFDPCTGISGNQPQVPLSIYPNPASGNFMVNVGCNPGSCILEIFSPDGGLQWSYSLVAGINQIQNESMVSGVYILRIILDGSYHYFRLCAL